MFYTKKQNKYHNISQIYNGISYDSKKEAAYAKELDLRLKAKDIQSWRRQVSIQLSIYSQPICKYYMDFEITHNDGTIEMVEIKGFQTEIWRLKWKILEAIYEKEHPEIILTIIR